MLRRWLRRWLGVEDVYVVHGFGQVFGVSARLQGAELIRGNVARAYATGPDGDVTEEDYVGAYSRLQVENLVLQDED